MSRCREGGRKGDGRKEAERNKNRNHRQHLNVPFSGLLPPFHKPEY
jgi:hypothetical protein